MIPHAGGNTPDGPAEPDTPENGNTDARLSVLNWLRNLIKKLLRLFKINVASEEDRPC